MRILKMNEHSIPGSLSGYLIAYVVESFEGRDICIYGNPEGLRSLGEAIIAIADLNQKSLSENECPANDSFHQHYLTGEGTAEYIRRYLPRLTVGRVDEKSSGETRDYFPELG